MIGIKFLGSGGSVSSDTYTSCIQITNHTLIDAGNIMHALGEKAQDIENIYLSHSHLDHIIDSAFLLDNFFETRKETLKIYALPHTIKVLQKYIYNDELWPDFTKIDMPNSSQPSLKFIPIEVGKRYEIEDGISLTPFESVHSIPCCGYIIEKENNAIFYSGDTFQNKKLWEYINKHQNIKALVIDVSFPNRLKKVAQESKHLTAEFLEEDMKNLKRDDIKLYVNHLKPVYREEIIDELAHIDNIDETSFIRDGDIILYKDGSNIQFHEKITRSLVSLCLMRVKSLIA